MIFFTSGLGFKWEFLVMHFYLKGCNWVPKTFEWILELFVLNMPCFVVVVSARTKISWKCSILSIVSIFWRHQVFSKVTSRCLLIFSLIFYCRWWGSSIQSNSTTYVFASSSLFFLQKEMAWICDYLWKPIHPFSIVLNNNKQLMFYYVYCCKFFLKDKIRTHCCTCLLGPCWCQKRNCGQRWL